jgi:hypothetical protein
MYYTHNLRTNLEEWTNRVYRSTYQNFENNYNFLFSKFEQVPLLKSLLTEVTAKHPLDSNTLNTFYKEVFQNSENLYYQSEADAASTCFQFLTFLKNRKHTGHTILMQLGSGGQHSELLETFMENYIKPITHYLHDRIDDASFTLYLLEKYKFRVEWFIEHELLKKYQEDNSEDILENHLRLFLFDQGVDYPFSTTRSASGRADVVGLLDTEDPLVLEIKIFDSQRGYRKNRVIAGFSQIVKYASDYNKSVGYLVVFNLENIEINIETTTAVKTNPKSIIFNHKTYFIIIINLNNDVTASKQGKLKVETITEAELVKEISEPA